MEVASESARLLVPPCLNQARPSPIHRHRRSAAVSGDFDIPGNHFGPNLHSLHSASRSLSTCHDFSAAAANTTPSLPYSFNNANDFVEPPDPFSFPLGPPAVKSNHHNHHHHHHHNNTNNTASNSFARDVCTTPPMSPRQVTSAMHYASPHQKRALFAPRLDSPIRLGQSPSQPVSTGRFFMTEDSNTLSKTIFPNPIIDLDDALVSPRAGSSRPPLLRTLPPSFESGHVPSLARSPGPVTPLQLCNDAFFVDTVEEENDTDVLLDVQGSSALKSDDLLQQPHLLPSPQYVPPGAPIYANLLCGSSLVSLRNQGNGDTASAPDDTALLDPADFISPNASHDSGSLLSHLHPNSHHSKSASLHILSAIAPSSSPPRAKRLGAKASRYLSFYDQSNRVSNALKASSMESVNLNVSASVLGAGAPGPGAMDRKLGHSSSLPILKPPPPPPPPHSSNNNNNNNKRQPAVSASRPVNPSRLSESCAPSRKVSGRWTADTPGAAPRVPELSQLCTIKTFLASPVSIHSDALSSTESVHSTDRLSLTSHRESNTAKLVLPILSHRDASAATIVLPMPVPGSGMLAALQQGPGLGDSNPTIVVNADESPQSELVSPRAIRWNPAALTNTKPGHAEALHSPTSSIKASVGVKSSVGAKPSAGAKPSVDAKPGADAKPSPSANPQSGLKPSSVSLLHNPAGPSSPFRGHHQSRRSLILSMFRRESAHLICDEGDLSRSSIDCSSVRSVQTKALAQSERPLLLKGHSGARLRRFFRGRVDT